MIYLAYKDTCKTYGNLLAFDLMNDGYELTIVEAKKDEDWLDTIVQTLAQVQKDPETNRAILLDEDGTLPYIAACKQKGIVAAQLFDEHTAKMTRAHNNTSVITLGACITALDQAHTLVKRFLESKYDGGRHQIRVDMLEVMA
jgi:galactose-6-phosphate isomerase